MAYYRICPDCGARLDPGERCDCHEQEQAKPVTQKIKPMQDRKEIAYGSDGRKAAVAV